jgi:hypothetical protein
MNLSRTAKKFRAEMPPESKTPKPVKEKQTKSSTPPPAVEPVAEAPGPVEVIAEEVAAPAVEPVAAAPFPEPPPPPAPKQAWPVKAKRPRFVREKV